MADTGQAGEGPGQGLPRLSVAGFEGPLDFLLEMVRRQRVDLAPLSIVALTDQLVAALAAAEGAVPLEQRGAWLVLASELVRLKSQLLAPRSPAEAALAEDDARRRLALWRELGTMRAAAAWLADRPQLGRAVHARGRPERPARPRAAQILAFWEATLVMLEGRPLPDAAPPAAPPPPPLDLERLPEAVARLRRMLAANPSGGPLARFLPPLPAGQARASLRRRAGLASTFLAALEMARAAELELSQLAAFAPIGLAPPPLAPTR